MFFCVFYSSDEFTPVEGEEKNNSSESSSEGIVCSYWTEIKTNLGNAAISQASTVIMGFFLQKRRRRKRRRNPRKEKTRSTLRTVIWNQIQMVRQKLKWSWKLPSVC